MYLARKQLSKSFTFFVIGMAFVVITFIVYNLNQTAINSELVALDLLPKPQPFTELYFNDGVHLPDSVTTAHSVISFSFVIHNLEATDYQYTYEVYVDTNGIKNIVDNGTIFVKNNHYYDKHEKFALMNSPGRQEVIVELTNKQQSIHFG